MGKELEDRIDIEDEQSLVGKRLIASVIIKVKEGKPRRNNIVDYRLIRQRRRSAAATTEVAKPAPAPEVASAAKEIFEQDDLPF